jgi:hypothetical protein
MCGGSVKDLTQAERRSNKEGDIRLFTELPYNPRQRADPLPVMVLRLPLIEQAAC